MDLEEIGWRDADSIVLAQNTESGRVLMNAVTNRVPENAGNFQAS